MIDIPKSVGVTIHDNTRNDLSRNSRLACFSNIVRSCCSNYNCYIFKDKCKQELRNPELAFFREDYCSEVNSLFKSIYRYNREGQPEPIPYNEYKVFKAVVTTHPKVWKRMLQHIYTHDETEGVSMYQNIKKAVSLLEKDENDQEGKKLFEDFLKDYYRHERIQTSMIFPKFGICDECKHIDLVYVKEHTKLLEQNPNFWNIF